MAISYNTNKPIDELLSNNYVVLESGMGQFQVINVDDRISKNGNKMVEITFNVKDANGQKSEIKEFITEGNEMTEVNIAKFLASVNAYDDFDGSFNAGKYLKKVGKCEIYHEEFVSKNGNVLQSNRMEKMPFGKEWTERKYKSKKLTDKEIAEKKAELGIYDSNQSAYKPDSYLGAVATAASNQASAKSNAVESPVYDDDIPF